MSGVQFAPDEDDLRSSNRRYIPEVDELRGIAAVLVLLYHSAQMGAAAALGHTGWLNSGNPLASFLFEGHTGVALFMVLSGFILATGTLRQDVSYSKFLINRVVRIFPLMILVLVFSLYATKDTDFGHIIAPFLLLANWPSAFNTTSGLAGTVWTASVEFQFYLIAPFLFLFVKAHGGLRYLLPAILLFWIFKVIILLPLGPSDAARVSYYTIVGRLDQFMIGIGLAYLVDSERLRLDGNRGLGFGLLAGASIAILFLTSFINRAGGLFVWQPWHILYPELEALIWAVFIAGYAMTSPFRHSRFGSIWRKLGEVSFSMYVLHYAMLSEWWGLIYPKYLYGFVTGMPGVMALTCLISLPIIGVSFLSYRSIERPFLRMRRRYVSQQTVT